MEKVGRSADEDADFDDVNELRITGEGGGDSDESSEGRMASGRDRDADTDADEQGPKSMDDDVYEGGGEEAAAWMNAGLEKGLGEETDKGEELDMDDKVSESLPSSYCALLGCARCLHRLFPAPELHARAPAFHNVSSSAVPTTALCRQGVRR